MEENTFDPDLIRAIFRLVWERRGAEREKNQLSEPEAELLLANTIKFRFPTTFCGNKSLHPKVEVLATLPICICGKAIRRIFHTCKMPNIECNNCAGPSTSKRSRLTSANANALKLSCELLRVFVTEAIQRAATIAEAEGSVKIEATHLERILPQLLLDF